MKSKLLLVSAVAAAFALIMPVLVSDVALAQSGGRKMGGAINRCYKKDGRSVRCENLDAQNKKADAMKDKKNK
jgi:hypothetical protein